MKRSIVLLSIAILLLFFILLISGHFVRKTGEDLIESARNKATLKTLFAARMISEFVQERLKVLDTVSSWINPFWITSPEAFEQDIDENVQRLLKQYPGFESLHFINRKGVVLWGVPESRSMKGVNFLTDLSNPSSYKTLFETARKRKRAILSPLQVTYFDPVKGNLKKTEVMLMAAPVFRSETYYGVLLAILKIDAVAKRFFPLGEREGKELWMLAGNHGELLFATDAIPQEVRKEISQCCGLSGQKTKCNSRIIQVSLINGENEKFLLSCSDLLLNFSKHWHVVRIYPLKFIEREMGYWLLQTRIISGIAILVIVLVAVFIVGSLQRSEKKLDLMNRKYRALLDNLFVGIFSFDHAGRIDYVNQRGCDILGYTPEELIGKDRLFFAWDKERPKIEQISRLRIEGKKGAETYRTHMVRKSGQIIDVEIHAFPVADADGKVESVRVFFTDITRQLEMEREIQNYTRHLEELVQQRTQALRESETLYRNIFETSLAIIYIHQDERFKIMNKRGMEFYGFESEEEMLRANVWDTVPEGERQRRMENARRRINGEDVPRQYESLIINKAGEIRVVACHFQRIQYKGEAAILAILFDVTEKKHLEAEVVQAEKLKSMGQLATGIAHDFNNILFAILGRIQLLEQNPNDPQMALDCAEKIKQAVEQGANTIKRIQEHTRVRRDRFTAHPLPLHQIIEDAIEITRYAWKDQAQKQGITIKIEKALEDDNRLFSTELREVFMNVILNAVHAMPNGGTLRIKTRSLKVNGNHGGAQITFEDEGVGISPEMLKHIFKPFFSTKGSEGSGLGLAIVSEVVKKLGGTVEIDSKPGKGTKLTITLPWQPTEKDSKGWEDERGGYAGKKRKGAILIVDDEVALPEIFKDFLSSRGFEVATATSGEEALQLFLKNSRRFGLIFTDLGMPGMNGWQLVKKIREIEKNIPIILMTGWGLEISEEDIRKAQVTELLSKPVTLNRIKKIVSRYLETP